MLYGGVRPLSDEDLIEGYLKDLIQQEIDSWKHKVTIMPKEYLYENMAAQFILEKMYDLEGDFREAVKQIKMEYHRYMERCENEVAYHMYKVMRDTATKIETQIEDILEHKERYY